METNSIVSKNTKNLRNKFGYTQAFIADYLNISAAAVNQYENDARSVPTSVIEKLALLYNVEEYDFYEENAEKQSLITAFAFRAGELSATDMQTIVKFKKIVTHYINMSIALENEQS
jgi:transcriptional regulator with XRE-family HTH domain